MPLNFFYGIHFPVLLIHLCFFCCLDFQLLIFGPFLFGHGQSMLLLAPGMEEVAHSKKYKLTFARLYFAYHEKFKKFVCKGRGGILTRLLGALLFFSPGLPFLGFMQSLFYVTWGVLICEGTHFIGQQYFTYKFFKRAPLGEK